MALLYVTGLSGTGKSAVLSELPARGYHARGVDEDGYADWVSLASGTPDHYLRDDPGLDFHAWQAAHTWVLSPRRISVLSRAAARLGGPVFLCGTADGDASVWHLFSKVLALVADVPTIRRRIDARPDQFGRAPEELAAVLGWQASYEADYRRYGAIIIDATRPLGEVVDEILAVSADDSPQPDEKRLT